MFFRTVQIRKAGKKGRGVFAGEDIAAGSLIERAPVIVLSPEDRLVAEKTKLYNYIFSWGQGDEEAGAVALGYISMYNHASPSNAEYTMFFDKEFMEIKAMVNIPKGAEITLNYSAHWQEEKPVWFKMKD